MIDLSIIDNYKTFTEEDIYKYYGISKEEIELIDSVIDNAKKQPKTKAKKKSKKIILKGGAKKKKTKKKNYCLSLSSFTRRLKTKLNNNRKPKKTRRK
jgi:sorbitol-specific phosphotransferase system component IIBC